MKSIFARNARRILALTTFASAITGAAIAGPVEKSSMNGGFITVGGYDSSGCTWMYIYAGKAGTTAAPQTWLSYDVYDTCGGQWVASGSGLIPNSALKVGNKTATLVVTPSASATFTVYQGAVSSIQLTFAANDSYSSTTSGHTRVEYAGHAYQTHGSWTEKNANVSGTVMGFNPGSYAGFGQSREKTMTIDRGSK